MFRRHNRLSGKVIAHGFFGRRGGVSTGVYESLNCGLGTEDDADAVRENRARACRALDLNPDSLIGLMQVHSDICMVVSEPWTADRRPQADAMVTDRPGIALGILTADCAPVLFFGKKADGRPVIGAAHAGWGGALKGVLESTYVAMMKAGATKSSVRAVIGPCIGRESYEVSEDFKKPFLTRYTGSDHFFHKAERKGHLMFDLPSYIRRRMEIMGVSRVSATGKDTYPNEREFFSYRRSVHRKEADYGRQISIIAIRE